MSHPEPTKAERSEIEILHDRYGIPHVYASSLDAALFGVGYAQAQDRLFQMELARRSARGRLAEILGEPVLNSDRFFRYLGLERLAEADVLHLGPEEQTLLQSYANGINRFIETHQDSLPMEFGILKCSPSPWKPSDTLSIARNMAWWLTANWDTELLRSWIVGKFSKDIARLIFYPYPEGKPVIFPSGTKSTEAKKLSETEADKIRELAVANPATMSNNWVVDGQKSETGRPLLANDPHLPLSIPGIWHEIHMQSPQAQAIGAGIPGTPGVLIGHNGHVAWGVTNAYTDGSDFYEERIRDADGTPKYEDGGVWKDAEVFHEEIIVRGRSSNVIEKVLVTRHGPLLGPLLPAGQQNLAIQSVALGQTPHIMRVLLGLWQARSWDDFRKALGYWSAPAQNFVYADIHDNIGYQLAAKVPIRKNGYGLLPSPGWTAEYDWTGFVPFEKLPSELNPPTHYVATANNKIVNDDYPYFLGADYAFYRAERTVELLEMKEKLSTDDFKKMQVDRYSIPARELIRLMANLEGDYGPAGHALRLLRDWDCILSTESIAASIFEVFSTILCRRALEEKLGREASEVFLGRPFLPLVEIRYEAPWLIQRIKRNHDWFKGHTWSEVMQDCLVATMTELTRLLGDDITKWQWGKLHAQAFEHPLGQIPGLASILNRGPISHGGDGNTVWASHFTPFKGYAAVGVGVSYRQIIDLANPEKSIAILPTGQSGDPKSRHYDDMTRLWAAGEYHPLLWNREEIERHLESRETIDIGPS